MKLKISNQLSLPIDVCTQTIAIVAKRRVGKTYSALVMAEEFVSASIPFVFLDPLGAAWGLRSSSNGKSDGLPVVIIGGSHGDVPLEPTAGKVIADLVVDKPGFYVIDMSLTNSNADQDRFACDFAERLYRNKEKKRDPLHLFVDEADSFAPQQTFPNQKRMLGAFEAIVRRGGIRGLGTTLITQRPAVLNKNVLTQTECLIVLQMNAPQDKKAVDDWVKDNGTQEQRDILMQSLATLKKGEAWIWSPSWLEVFQKVQIRERYTFDSSATPKHGVKVTAQKMAVVDLDWLSKEISATVERAKENDPGHLKKELSLLRTELIKEKQKYSDLEKKQAVQQPGFSETEKKLIGDAWEHSRKTLRTTEDLIVAVRQFSDLLGKLLERAVRNPRVTVSPKLKCDPPGNMNANLKAWEETAIEARLGDPGIIKDNGKLPKCERAILQVLAQYPHGRYPNQVALITGYSKNSGSFMNALSYLRSHGLITRNQPMTITEAGREASGTVEELPSGEPLQRIWLNKLPKAEREILKYLLASYPDGAVSQQVADAIGYSVNSGSFANALCKLRTLELITRGQPMRASENFFQ